MDGTDQYTTDSLDLDALAVSDRFRLFNFTRRDDHVAYLWVLRALERLRAVHQVQAHSEDVAQALSELARNHGDVPAIEDVKLRERLDALAEDQILHRLEDASRAGSLARYRNRQSVYQFSELGYRAYAAVEDVLKARVRDANLSRLVFSDILEDLKGLAGATRNGDKDQVYRRLSRLDTVLDDMSRRAAQFHLTLGEIVRSTDTSPDTFLRYKNALLTHMTDVMAERIGETFLRGTALLALTLTALRRHDTEEVRALLLRAAAAVGDGGYRIPGVTAVQAWLAWQDGRPDDVIRLSARVAELDLTTIAAGARYQWWVYLFPLIAVRLAEGSTEEAVAAARRTLDPTQQLLPDDLTGSLEAASAAWDRDDRDAAARHLKTALDLAREHHYF